MSDHEARRELCAKVAAFMGTLEWDWVIEGTSRAGPYATREEAMAAKPALERRHLVGDLVLGSSVPDYPADIAAAWDVVEKLRATHWTEVDCVGRPDQVWRATFTRMSDPVTGDYFAPVTQIAETAPLAICRAALKAVDHA